MHKANAVGTIRFATNVLIKHPGFLNRLRRRFLPHSLPFAKQKRTNFRYILAVRRLALTSHRRTASFQTPLQNIVKRIIHQALTPLIRLPLRNISRSANLLCVHFGGPRVVSDRDSTKTVPDWTLQVQCPWRISQSTHIVIAYRDFYYSDVPLSNLAVMNKSRLNSVLETLSAEFETTPPVVESVETDDSGGFSVHLTSDYRLEVFPGESMESGKHWRIFQPGVPGGSFVFPPGVS